MRSSGFIAIWLFTMGLVLAVAGCVYHPSYEGTRCTAGGECPSGYVCNNDVCVLETAPDGGEDAADAAGDGDAGPDGVDEQPDGADEEPDGTDETQDGADEEPDGTDETQDGADGPPCPDGCLPNQYCDEASNQCKPCEDSTHCGQACLPCDNTVGETCQNLGAGGFCCLGPCDYAHACQRKDCNGTIYICLATTFQQPIVYSWLQLSAVARDLFCALSDQDGLLPDRRCAADGHTMILNCPWDGKCDPSGTCQLDLAIDQRTHECGAVFGCQDGVCGRHFVDGASCLYNFDCQSYCCSPEPNGKCQPAGTAESQCKGRNARYFDGAEPRCFKAWSATPHDPGTWTSESDWNIDCASPCGHNDDCDSGKCGDTLNGKRCWIDCAGGNEGDIRNNYFCATGDSAAHVEMVTNSAAEPVTPENCVY